MFSRWDAAFTCKVSIIACTAIIMCQMYTVSVGHSSEGVLPAMGIPSRYMGDKAGLQDPPPLLSEAIDRQVLYVWGPLLGVALLAVAMRNPLSQTMQAYQLDRRRENCKLFFNYQLPPRKLWTWLLENGLTVTDLILVLVWISLNACWLSFGFRSSWQGFVDTHKKLGSYENGTYIGDVCQALGSASAWAAVYNLVFLFLPLARNNFLQYLFGTTFPALIKYHRWLGHGALFISLLHGVFFYIGWFAVSAQKFRDQCFAWDIDGRNQLAGTIAFFPFGLMLWCLSIPTIRRRFFKVFLSSHICGFIGFMVFLEMHYPSSMYYSCPGLALYFLDVAFRIAQWRITSGMQCTFVSADRSFVSLKLRFSKAARVKSSQFLFLNVPAVSWFDWHPISIASVTPAADGQCQDVVLHLKALGAWSRAVVERLAVEGVVAVRADGPYGSTQPEWMRYHTVVMVAGGIGITPLLEMLREIQRHHYTASAYKQEPVWPRVHLIWAVRHRDELQLMDKELLLDAGLPRSWLTMKLFQTSPLDQNGYPYSDLERVDSMVADSVLCVEAPAYRSLQPYGFGDFHWACCHVLAVVGALCACLMVSALSYEGLITSEKGYHLATVGSVMFLAAAVGSMGLPALAIFPLHILRYRRHVRACEVAHESPLYSELNGAEDPSSCGKVDVAALPDRRAGSGVLDLETGEAVRVSTGRPNLSRLLTAIVSQEQQEQQIGVIASGPTSLIASARQATHEASKAAARLGMRGIPELAFSNHSFVL